MAKDLLDYKFDPRKKVRVRERPRLTLVCPDDGMTQQQFKAECDINEIMRKYRSTGTVPMHQATGMYGDFSNIPDYMTSLNIVREADEAFGALPAELRKRFDNDPAQFLAFCSDSANGEELIKMGLREAPKPPEEPVQVRVVPEPEAKPGAP